MPQTMSHLSINQSQSLILPASSILFAIFREGKIIFLHFFGKELSLRLNFRLEALIFEIQTGMLIVRQYETDLFSNDCYINSK